MLFISGLAHGGQNDVFDADLTPSKHSLVPGEQRVYCAGWLNAYKHLVGHLLEFALHRTEINMSCIADR